MLDRPGRMLERLTRASEMHTDVRSDVLRAVRLAGAVYFDFDLTAPWVAEAPPSREIASIVLPGSQRVIEYHLMVKGSAWGHAVGEPPIRFCGDLLFFPQGDAHVLASAPGMRAAPNLAAYARGSTPLPLFGPFSGAGSAGTAPLEKDDVRTNLLPARHRVDIERPGAPTDPKIFADTIVL
jgi:hypothetical protein